MKFCTIGFFFLLLAACNGPEEKNFSKRYVDLEGYFSKEAERLQKLNPLIVKKVSQNLENETRQLTIADWKTELSLFIESDINKPAWRDSYQIKTRANDITEYIATSENLKTRKIVIHRDKQGEIQSISISNKTSNPLYTSVEELTYQTRSGYQIHKSQAVKIIGKNSYSISATFKNQ
jgi:hypothetical protein